MLIHWVFLSTFAWGGFLLHGKTHGCQFGWSRGERAHLDIRPALSGLLSPCFSGKYELKKSKHIWICSCCSFLNFHWVMFSQWTIVKEGWDSQIMRAEAVYKYLCIFLYIIYIYIMILFVVKQNIYVYVYILYLQYLDI